MKKVSIITPVYNTEKYLKRCIDSVLNDDYKDIELIIVNDGSKGNCDEIINSYQDNRIVYLKEENSGIGKARNNALDKATGDYIIFLDSDDSLNKNAIKTMVDTIESKNYDMVVSNYEDVYENGKIEKIDFNNINNNIYNNPRMINIINLGPSNKIYKRELFDNLRFPENVKYEDFALVLKLISKSLSIGHTKEYLFNFNRLSTGETLTVDKRVFDIFASLKDVIDYFDNLKYPKDSIKESVKEEINYFVTMMCTLYATKQKHQKDKEVKTKFINEAYEFLNKYVPNYKQNKYFKDCNIFKRIIQKSKWLLKIYCSI